MMGKFTGFAAYGPTTVMERNNAPNIITGKIQATNWPDIDHDKVTILELWWKGQCKDRLVKKDIPGFLEWVFYHTGTMEKGQSRTISRSIGFKSNKGNYITTVDEETGKISTKVQ